MPNRFSRSSVHELRTVVLPLQALFGHVLERYDCTIIKGHRGEAAQNRAFAEGNSKLEWPDGDHNEYPSKAVDAAPYPVKWGGPVIVEGKLHQGNLRAILRFYHFAGYVQGVAEEMGIPLRWGGDWDRDFDLFDQKFNDLVHFEIDE